MNAQLRGWYLNALGITEYVPRATQPSAAPEIAELETMPEAAPQPATRRQHIKIDLGPDQPPEVNSSQALEESVEPETSAIHQAVSFRLACWQPVDDLLVVDSLNPGEQPGAERMQLLANILKAIRRLPAAGVPRAELIDWPAAKGGLADEAGARAMLSVFLDARIKKCGVCWVLLMGEQAAAYIGQETRPFNVGERRELSGGATAILCHSLSTMLQEPATKAETWQAIQFLASIAPG